MRRRLVGTLAASVPALALSVLALGCSSAKLTDLDPEQTDLDQKRESLVTLGKKAHAEPDLRGPLAEKARHLAEDETTSVAIRVVALRVLANLAQDGWTQKEITELLAQRARIEVEKDFWCRIEALMDLAKLAIRKDEPALAEVARPRATEACADDVKPEEPDRDVRIHAACQLALMAEKLPAGERPERALPELVRALSDETPDVRWHVTRALLAIAGGDHGPSKEDWERWRVNQAATAPEPQGK